MTKVLILGGYGVFGKRICQLFSDKIGWRIFVAGRNLNRAKDLCQNLNNQSAAKFIPLVLDATQNIAPFLKTHNPKILINTSGPFQGADYNVAEACIEAKIHYIDIADGRDFVCGIGKLDKKAKKAGIMVISGASSVPGLSSTVIEHYCCRWKQINTISAGITPGNRVPRGKALIEGILSYTGIPISCWVDGKWQYLHGWQNTIGKTIKVTKTHELPRRYFSLCDVPDLELFPKRWPGVQTVQFRAGLELLFLHFGLWILSWLPRLGLVKTLQPLSLFVQKFANLFFIFGSDRGGMFIEVKGVDKTGKPRHLLWSLIAEEGEGPYIPVIPAVILAEKLASKKPLSPGATPCLNLFRLEDFKKVASRFKIFYKGQVT